jgi:uncharacterized NAD(P)/FAD-binding protein YdhS
MVDTVMSLLDSGHRGPIHALSRRGLLPRCHAIDAEPAEFAPRALPSRVTALTKTIRQQIAQAEAQGVAWQAIIDALRPTMQGIWDSLSAVERGRFLRHIRPWWEVHRHRMPPAIAVRIEEAQRRRQLTTIRGRISAYRPAPRGVEVEFRVAATGTNQRIDVERIVNCSGPACDFERIRNPLIQGLLERGQLRPDPFRLGLDLTPQSALKSADGSISQRLYAIGPLTKGLFWEMTSVPDIRRQCELLATQARNSPSSFPWIDDRGYDTREIRHVARHERQIAHDAGRRDESIHRAHDLSIGLAARHHPTPTIGN